MNLIENRVRTFWPGLWSR